jgi:hypothetical protein
MRSFREVWREGFITPQDFVLSLLEIVSRSVPESLKYHFKLLDELLKSTNTYARLQIEHFILTQFSQEPSEPLSLAMLIGIATTHSQKGGPLNEKAFTIGSDLLVVQNQDTVLAATRAIACYAKYSEEPNPELFRTSFWTLLEIINAGNFPPKLLQHISFHTAIISHRFENTNEFHFPEPILDALLDSNEDGILCAITILQLIWKFVAVPTANNFIEKVITGIENVKSLYSVNAALKLISRMSGAHHETFHNAIIHFKRFILESKLIVFNGFPIWKFNAPTFQGFQFLERIQKNHFVLNLSEAYDLASWFIPLPVKMIPLFVRPLRWVVQRLAGNTEFSSFLWQNLLSRMNEEWLRFKPFSEMVELAHHFLTFHHEWKETNDMMNLLKKVWSQKETDDQYIALISPLFVLTASINLDFERFDFDFLSVICGCLMSQENNWDYAQMVQELLDIYENVGSWHILSAQFCHLLITFLAKGIKKLRRLGFADPLPDRMTQIAHELVERDSRVLEYVMERCQADSPSAAWIDQNFEFPN